MKINIEKCAAKMVWYKDTLKDIMHYCEKFVGTGVKTNIAMEKIIFVIDNRLKGRYVDFDDKFLELLEDIND